MRRGTFSEDMDSLVGLARAGCGVVLAPDYCVAPDVQAGTLVDVLPHWHLPVAEGHTVMALTLPHPLVGEAARALVRFVRQQLQASVRLRRNAGVATLKLRGHPLLGDVTDGYECRRWGP